MILSLIIGCAPIVACAAFGMFVMNLLQAVA